MKIRGIHQPTCQYCGGPADTVVAADGPLGGIMEVVTCGRHQTFAEDYVRHWEQLAATRRTHA